MASPAPTSSSQQPQLVKKAKKSRKVRASTEDQKSSGGHASRNSRRHFTEAPQPQESSSSKPQGSHRGQLVDLVVENREAEDEEREHIQKAFGSAAAEPGHKHFQ